ncbi:MAG TPA: hypothetical protein PKE55_05810 [Kiritimatiellia bacterium]|nr:hypothetical protein [Kiritimatiellia bacterium]
MKTTFMLALLALFSLLASMAANTGLTSAPPFRWTGLLGGWLVGAIQGIASPVLHHTFMKRHAHQAALFSLAYQATRMLIFLAVCALVFAFCAEEAEPFALSLLVTFVIMTGGESYLLYRWSNSEELR